MIFELRNSIFNSSYPQSSGNLDWTVQMQSAHSSKQVESSCRIDYSVPENRLYQHFDGTIRLQEKPLGVVIGEKILRPIIDLICDIVSAIFRLIKSVFSFLNDLLPKNMFVFPTTYAQPIPNEIIDVDNNQISIPKSDSCSSLPPHPTIKQRVECIQQRTGIRFLNPSQNAKCEIYQQISTIKNIKKPDRTEQKELTSAYHELQIWANEDNLASCHQEIMGLLTEFETYLDSYSIGDLRPLHELAKALLHHSTKGYTFTDLEFLIDKINEISRKMIPMLQKTNHQEMLLGWIDLMIDSAQKNVENRNFLVASFETILKIVQSQTKEILPKEQTKAIRKMVNFHKNSLSTPEEKDIGNDILMLTQHPIWLVAIIHSYLEEIPLAISETDNHFQEIISELLHSTTIHILTLLAIAIPLYRKMFKGTNISNPNHESIKTRSHQSNDNHRNIDHNSLQKSESSSSSHSSNSEKSEEEGSISN